MINYIVVDDVKFFVKEVSDVINGVMMKNKFEYKINTYKDYNQEFMSIINSPIPNKVYILDIETPTCSGIDIARKIRLKDVNSVIIFLTAHEELSSVVSKDQLMVLTFICKFDDFKINLKKAITKSLLIIGKNSVIRVKDYSAIYTIDINDILYVTRDSVERKSIIKTDYSEYKINKSLIEIKELCLGKLKQTHRGCLVNEDRIIKIDIKKSEILFDTGEKIDLISQNYKKEIV